MSPRYWNDWPESRGPISVEGGIKARSQRGAIGEKWWSRRFIAALESYGMSGRLQRGRNYARRGQVLEFSLTVGKVTARVQGSRPQPYKVTITVLPLTTPQWKTVESRLAAQALFRAKLLAGEMPAEIERVFADCGTPLFPRSAADLDMHCSCPDWEVPCKHLAAVCYVLAEAFDDDPFAMLAWRGRDRDTLLAALRGAGRRPGPGGQGAGRHDRVEAGLPAVAVADASATRAVLADVTGPPLAQAGDFWSPGLSQARLRALAAPAVAATVPDLLLRMFDPPALTVRGKDLRTVLSAAYEQLGG
ncbi:SWIM zinc finger family protein [Trebonia sp.]|uniref:SWIM zinc finger family protein n=1 Tax=Trebonia sp. TaxID=2767075 RepID=UPI002605D33C|nr:SWIM zinc finger family protein [Trebonia sp.]